MSFRWFGSAVKKAELIATVQLRLRPSVRARSIRKIVVPLLVQMDAQIRAFDGNLHTSASVDGIKIQPLETVRWTCHSNYNVASTGDGPHVSGYLNKVPAPTPALL